MRPHNETPEDIEREKAVVASYNNIRGTKGLKLSPALYGADFAILDPGSKEVQAWVEVKVYTQDVRAYVPLSFGKYRNLVGLSAVSGLPALLLVKTPTKLLEHELARGGYRIKVDGRTDRGQPGDLEPCIIIEPERFRVIPA